MIRRAFLARTVGLAGAIPLLAACAAPVPNSPPAPPTARAGLQLPSYIPVELVKPDLPGTAAGVDPAYLTFPKNRVRSVTDTPSKGGDVTAFTRVILAAPPPVEQNPAWQAVNKAIGANMKINMVPSAEYNTKLATTIAGNDIPDLVFLSSLQILGIPQFLEKACADLTPYVGGDAIKDYPNLANIPPIAWKQTVYNNGIYGVPIPRPYVQGIWFINQTRFEAVGAGQPKNGAEFKQTLQALTTPSSSQWGISGDAQYAFGLTGITSVPQLAMFHVPNNWRVDDKGNFVKDIETDEFKAALAYTRDLWSAGVFFPDALTTTSSDNKINLVAGRFAVYPDGWFSYPAEYWDRGLKLNPPVKFRTLHPFSNDGGTPIWHQYQAFNGMTAIKKGTPDRVKEMLRILNYLAAPFGSEEAFLLEFGVKDIDYRLDANGNPVLTQQGVGDTTVSWRYMAQRPQVLFDANDTQDPRHRVIPLGYFIEEYWASQFLSHGDVFERYPELQVVISHCGAGLHRHPPTDRHLAQKDLSRNLFYDTSAYDVNFLEAGLKQHGVSQSLFGTEAPGSGGFPRPDTGLPHDDLVPVISSFPFLSEADRVCIFNTNPARLFPKLKEVSCS